MGNRAGVFLVSGVMCLMVLAYGRVDFFGSLYDLQKGLASLKWPVTDGKILSSDFLIKRRVGPKDESTQYFPEIVYSYSVDGAVLSSTQVSYGEKTPGEYSREYAETFLRDYPEGNLVKVYYDPKRPEFAVLEPGITQGTFQKLSSGSVYLAAALVMVVISFLMFLKNARKVK